MRSYGYPPYLDISSKGKCPDLNAYYIKLKRYGNRTIEEVVQTSKIFADGRTGLSVKEAQLLAKKVPIINSEYIEELTRCLWLDYLKDNNKALKKLLSVTGLCDSFATSQNKFNLDVLWRLRFELQDKDIKESGENLSLSVVRKQNTVSWKSVDKRNNNSKRF